MRLIDFLDASELDCNDVVQLQYDESERMCYFGAIRDIPFCFLMRPIAFFIDIRDDINHPVFIISECEVSV